MAFLVNLDLPCLFFEDEHLLVVNKPPGMNTHAPGPYSGEGIYDWLRHREPRWAGLAIIHRLDKETSGVLVFAKTPVACKSLTDQFTRHEVRKQYLLAVSRPADKKEFSVKSSLRRQGDRYVSLPVNRQDPVAETMFEVLEQRGDRFLLKARPLTGRTHQIRVHAASQGLPVLGDTLYGGAPAERLWLHAAQIELRHPATGEWIQFEAKEDFDQPSWLALRRALINESATNAWRWIHGAADGYPNLYAEQWAGQILLLSDGALPADWARIIDPFRRSGVYHKQLNRRIRLGTPAEACPRWIEGAVAPEEFEILENGLRYAIRFSEGYSRGLFLDQRDNRRRVLNNYVGKEFPLRKSGLEGAAVLNTFAYTCGFSVCAARAGARVCSVDLSKKYLEWGRRNFALNGLAPENHEFLYGDVFDWLKRLRKKERQFDLILLDPPTFSSSRQSGVFQACRDYTRLVKEAALLLAAKGVLFCSTNAAQLAPEDFLKLVQQGLQEANRRMARQLYMPQPPDFPVTRDEPAYLKTVWVQVD